MDLLVLLVLLIGSLLSSWAISLAVRALAERAEMRALRRLAQSPDPSAPPRTPAPPPRRPFNRTRNILVFAFAPPVFAAGLLVCWIGVGFGRDLGLVNWLELMGRNLVVVALAQVQLAAACLCVGWWFDPSRGRRRCPRCWYDMAGHTSRLCPECGHEARTEQRLFRTRRKPILLWICAVLLGSIYVTFKAPVAARSGPLAFVPTTLMIPIFERLPQGLVLDRVQGSVRDNLEFRINEREAFDWQQKWLENRACAIAATSSDPGVLLACAAFIHDRELTPSDPAIERLFSMIGSADPNERLAAATTLEQVKGVGSLVLGPGDNAKLADMARPYATAAAAHVADGEWTVAAVATWMAGRDPRAVGAAYPLLLNAINSTASPRSIAYLSQFRIYQLSRLALASPDAMNAFISLLDSQDAFVRRAAIEQMLECCKSYPDFVSRLEALLEDPADEVAAAAASSLAPLVASEPLARRALEHARTRVSSQDTFVAAAPGILLDPGPHDQLPPWMFAELGRIIADRSLSPAARIAAVDVVREYSRGARELLPTLHALADAGLPDESSRWQLRELIDRLESGGDGPDAPAAQPPAGHSP